jgi:glycosyltransferase involved in cell wall biosynthesis/polysaccharide pyruvyl transferase WcaK-like protein
MKKPRILLLVDKPGWAFDVAAHAFIEHMSDAFEFKIEYVVQHPDLSLWPFDLIYVFFWGETYHQKFINDPRRIIKEVASHRWALEENFGLLTPSQMAQTYLLDAGTIVTISKRLQEMLSPFRDVYWAPNGFEPERFNNRKLRQGNLKIGWAGNLADPCKGVQNILIPAAGDDFDFQIAGGDTNYLEMSQFYNSIDVICIASTAEGEPLTLLEAMACGCYPVCVNVGIVPELIQSGRNGLIIEHSTAAFQAAFQYCYMNIDKIRKAGEENSLMLLNIRQWGKTKKYWLEVFQTALNNVPAGNAILQSPIIPTSQEMDIVWQQNLGEDLLDWSERTKQAGNIIKQLPLKRGDSLADLGCGKQTLRQFIPSQIKYIPLDKIKRSPDTTIIDLNHSTPKQQFTVTVMLGVVEYLVHPEIMLRWCITNSDYFIFSFNDCSDFQRSERQHWKSRWSLQEIQKRINDLGGRIQQIIDLGSKECLFLVKGNKNIKKLALFSAGINGDNSGDAIIVDAIKRILAGNEMLEFPLLQKLNYEQLQQINNCDLGIICGTNLYQQIFACALTSEILGKIKIPILPLGIGSSSSIGQLPQMNDEGVKAIKMLHKKCLVSSVRDPMTYQFVRSIGIANVEITGCPVLFHGLTEPVFQQSADLNSNIRLSIRARLLHVEDKWIAKELRTLNLIAKQFAPTIILQSPYDIPIAQSLSQKYALEYILDERYSHEVLVENIKSASRTVGFRLHFGMLGLSYGKPATLIATDTRISSFCEMMGIKYHDICFYEDQDIISELMSPLPDMTNFVNIWHGLRGSMRNVLNMNGVNHVL